MVNKVLRFTRATQHLVSPGAYRDQSRIRYLALRDANWEISLFHSEEMEEDVYDTPKTVYFLSVDHNGEAFACGRLLPTDLVRSVNGQVVTFLSQDVFFRRANIDVQPTGPEYREASRLCTLPSLEKGKRRQGVAAVLYAIVCHCLHVGVRYLYGTMPEHIFDTTWRPADCKSRLLGTPFKDRNGEELVVRCKSMTQQLADNLRQAASDPSLIDESV